MRIYFSLRKSLRLSLSSLLLIAGPALATDATSEAVPPALTPITILATSQPRETLTTPASVTVLEGRELEQSRGQSPLSAVQYEPGVNIITQGPAVAKPVVRGLSSQDIVVVEDGVRNEVFQWGREHAPEIDPMSSDRVEILRGPNSLLYGSDALGGVISFTRPELPSTALGAGPLSGKITSNVESVNKYAGQGLLLEGAQGDWGYRGDYSQQQAGNIYTPAGTLPNTGFQGINGNGTVGVRKDWGTLSADYGHSFKHVEFQDDTFQDTEFQTLSHDKAALHATIPTELFRYDMTLGYDHSNRKEFDSVGNPDPLNGLFGNNDPVLHWEQWNYTADFKAHHAPLGPFTGTFGLSGLHRNEESLGEEHLTPTYRQNGGGIFALEEATLGAVTLSGGVRGDATQLNVGEDDLVGAGTDTPTPVEKQVRKYGAVTGALGGVWHMTDPLALALNVGRGYRNPTPFELFADGVHEGTGHVEVGNPNLKPETSLNTDVSLRYVSRRFKADLGVFWNRISNFIFTEPTGVTDTTAGLPIFRDTQGDSVIQGTDLALAAEATDWLTLTGGYDIVRGDNTGTHEHLPFIPSDRIKTGFKLHVNSLGGLRNVYIGPDAVFVFDQNKTSDFETRTGGYTLIALRVGTEVPVMGNRISVDAGVDNLTNKSYVDNLSLYKQVGLLDPGRNVYFKLSVPFGR